VIRNWHITPDNRGLLGAKLNSLDPTRQWVCNVTEKKSRRTNEQNKWMRGFAKAYGEELGYSQDDMYDILMYKFCPEFVTDPETKVEIRKPGHFSKLQDGTPRSTKDAADIQDAVQRWAGDLGFVWDDAA
jgi:hypothetical protein